MSLGLHIGAEAIPSQPYQQSFFPPVPTQGGLYTTYTITCTDQPSVLFPNPHTPSDCPSPTISHSGSSAENSSHYTDDEDVDPSSTQPFYAQEFTAEPAFIEHCSFLDTTPIFSSQLTIGYGVARITFIENLIWDCVDKVYAIYDEPANRTTGLPTSVPLEQLVYDGLIHGLCNEIVILPIVAAIQKLPEGQARHQADLIPFPLFMAEMLRRMKSSYFLLLTAMRYITDIESAIRSSRERAQCGWCRSGAYGCDHSTFADPSSTSRFSRGRVSNSRKIRGDDPKFANGIPLSQFSKPDPLSSLADPRKVFLGALILANKFHRDRSIGNKSWATLIGLPLEEVHSAERAVGQALGWTLSRPWVQGTKGDDDRVQLPGSTNPTLAEPLFATNSSEVERYGVKALRDASQLPLSSRSNESSPDSLVDVSVSIGITGPEDESNQSTPQRPRSRTLSISPESLRTTPKQDYRSLTPTRSVLSRLSNPIKKSNTAPYVLQPSAYGHGQETQDALEEIISQNDQLSSSVQTSQGFIDSFMETTPTLEPTRPKRKASEDFGPVSHLRRGTRGERLPVVSPSDSYLSYPCPPTASSSRSSTPSRHNSYSQFRHSDRNGSSRDHTDFEYSCPELSPTSTATTSPSIGLLTRTNTPGNLDAMVISDESQPSQRSGISRSSTHGHLGHLQMHGPPHGKRPLRRGSSIGPLVH
ncbi:hypothetical protein FRC15_007191 [Serendipita sp. 397]|nr:hypothetical protein FRC15_007191 [Serendipita sp. 397]